MVVVDNDGKAEVAVLYSEGTAKVWNMIDARKKFEALGSKWATRIEGRPRDKVQWVDIGSEGYADWLILCPVKRAYNNRNDSKDDSKRDCEEIETKAHSVLPPNYRI